MSTLLSVGNLKKPFVRLLHAVSDNVATLPGPVIVQHGHSPFLDSNCTAVPFLKMEEFQQRVADAAVVILHGGAGSIITALQAGQKPIVMARAGILVAEDAASLRRAVEIGREASRSGRSASTQRRTRMDERVASDLESWATHLKEHR